MMARKPEPELYPVNEFNPGRRSVQHLDLTPTDNLLEGFGAAWLRLWAITNDPETQEAQWQPGMTPVPREDTTERSKNLTNDPTPTIAMDGRRLALRDAVKEAERALEVAARVLQDTARKLAEALGDDLEPQNSKP